MRVIGIVAEYNPFHNGHKHLIDSVKSSGDIIVAVMSGNFVQRGDCAVFDKFTRAKAALQNGVDLIIELPLEYALSSAKDFAKAGVDALSKVGITHLAFGSECGDTHKLQTASHAVDDVRVNSCLRGLLEHGMTFAKARNTAVEKIFGENIGAVLQNPNDTLAVEYLSAINKIGGITPIAISRFGAQHDGEECGNIASASGIRQKIYNDLDYRIFVPENSYDIYKSADIAKINNARRAILWSLRQKNADYFENYDVSEGLHHRMYNAVRKAKSLDELYELIKTKRYTLARIRRAVIASALDTHKMRCPYIRVLGFNSHGAKLLKNAENVVTSHKTAKAQGYAEYFEMVSRTTDFYALMFDHPHECGYELTQAVLKI